MGFSGRHCGATVRALVNYVEVGVQWTRHTTSSSSFPTCRVLCPWCSLRHWTRRPRTSLGPYLISLCPTRPAPRSAVHAVMLRWTNVRSGSLSSGVGSTSRLLQTRVIGRFRMVRWRRLSAQAFLFGEDQIRSDLGPSCRR